MKIKNYKAPIVVGLILITIIFSWGYQQRNSLISARETKVTTFMDYLETTIKNSLDLFGSDSQSRHKVKMLIRDVAKKSPIEYVDVSLRNRSILRVGRVPRGISLRLPEGKRVKFEKGFIISSQDVKLESGRTVKVTVAVKPEGPPEKNMFKSEPAVLTIMVIGFLIIVISSIIWIALIRNKLLSSEIEKSKLKNAHLEELSLAAAGIVHETKNPLGIILGIAQQIKKDKTINESSREKIDFIIDEVDRASSRLGSFVSFAKNIELNKEVIDLDSFVRNISSVIGNEFNRKGITLEVTGEKCDILADKERLNQVLTNLMLNSLNATPEGGSVTISYGVTNKRNVELEILDNGCGIPSNLLKDIFKPYVTGRVDGNGLGLSIVKKICDAHKWSISVNSSEGKGTLVNISNIEFQKVK